MSPPAILDLLRLPLFAFGVPPSCLATLRFATIHVRPCALSPFSFKRSKLLLISSFFSLSGDFLSLQRCRRLSMYLHRSDRLYRLFWIYPLPLDSGASHAPIGGSIQQSYCTQSYHALSSVISRRRGLIPRPLAPGSVALPLTIDD